MGKRNYTHVQTLLPEIKAMLAEDKTQQEVAEHFGFKDKYVVKQLLIRERRKWQQLGQQVHRYKNLLNREFHTDQLNCKWVTDISYIHTNQGFQYTSQAYFQLTKQYGITPSMSRKGNPYDNAMAEHFFSILKTECIYRHKPATFAEANEMIDRYICFYNHERIQLKTGEAPLARRLST